MWLFVEILLGLNVRTIVFQNGVLSARSLSEEQNG